MYKRYLPFTNSGCNTTFLCCGDGVFISGNLVQVFKSVVLTKPAWATAEDVSPGSASGSFLSEQ